MFGRRSRTAVVLIGKFCAPFPSSRESFIYYTVLKIDIITKMSLKDIHLTVLRKNNLRILIERKEFANKTMQAASESRVKRCVQ